MPKIKFIHIMEEYKDIFPAPIPVTLKLPPWYKKQDGFYRKDQSVNDGKQYLTVKKCQAVFDSMTMGYYILAPIDIYIDATGDRLDVQIPKDYHQQHGWLIGTHSEEQIEQYPRDPEYHKTLFRIHPQWIVKTKRGYSTLFMNPMHSDTSPLNAVPGVIDTDKFASDGYFSFFVKRGFKGVVKQGTPLVQVFPFKREDWESELDMTFQIQNVAKQRLTARASFANGYRLKFWAKKTFK